MVPIQPRLPPPPTVYAPTIIIHESEEEREYFQFFRDHTAHELAGYYDPSFWTILIVQEAYALAPIRYALVAIGALNKSFASASMCDGKVTDLQTVDQTHHQFAVSHYIKAIQALNKHISDSKAPQLRTALIACILFACFETFEGSLQASRQQVNEGLKLLQNYYAGTPGSKSWTSATATTSTDPVQNSDRYVAHEGSRRLNGVATQLKDYLRLDSGAGPLQEGLVNIRRAGNDADSMMFETHLGSVPIAFDQHNEHFGEHRHHLTGPSAEQLGPQSSQQWNSNEYMTGQSSSESVHASRARTAEGHSLDLYDMNNSSYVPREPQHSSWVPQPEGVRRLSSTISSSSVSTAGTYSPPSTGIHTPNRSPQPHQRHLTPPALPILHNDIPIEDILIQTFVRLDGKCFLAGTVPQSLPLAWDINNIYHLPVPKYFSLFNSAHRCWVFLADRIHRFCHRTLFNRTHAPQACDPPGIIINAYTSLIKSLADFESALQPILDAAIEPNGNIVNPAALVLSMHHKVTLVVLSAVTYESEMMYDSFLSTFQNIVRTASLLNSGYNTSGLPRNPKFSLDTGFVPPLFVVATKCRDSVLRREALDLLTTNPTVEGVWDSLIVARVGHWLMDIEEESLHFEKPEIYSADTKLPTSEKNHPDISIQEPTEPAFSYPSPQSNNHTMFKSGSPFYDDLVETHESSITGRYDLRHRDTTHDLSMSDDSRRRWSEASMSTSNAYTSTRSRHHSSAGEINSNMSSSSIDPIFASASASTTLKRHSTRTTKNDEGSESGRASLSRVAAVASASLAPESIIARHKSIAGIIPYENKDSTRQEANSTNLANIDYDKSPTNTPTSKAQHASNLLNETSSYKNGSTIDPLTSHHSPTNWAFSTAESARSSNTSTPRPTKEPRRPMRLEQEGTRASWIIPESARVTVTFLDWHIPERYLRVACQRAVPGEDGGREVRETVLSW